jgi:predicted acyltransferase
VTNPGTYSAVYWPLLHSNWNGTTPTDMIFPSFLFIAGVAMTFSFNSRMGRGDTRAILSWHVIRRSAIIFALGLFINAFPQFDFHSLRIPGILQRIALCYVCGGLLYLASKPKRRSDELPPAPTTRISVIAGVAIAILIAYWALLKFVPVPGIGTGRLDSFGNLEAYIDRSILGIRHMWLYGTTPGYGVTFDPEGLLSTLPAIATLLIGILAGEWMRTKHSGSRKALGLAAIGIVLLLLGLLLNPVFPINKKLWTSTFVLFSGGFSLIAFSACYWIVDLRRWQWWTLPALIFGTNAIVSFVLASVLTSLSDVIHVTAANGQRLTLHQWSYSEVFAPWFSPYHASLAYAVAIVLLNLVIVFPLYRKRIFLRV